jgi:hypothetical protein
MQKKHNQEALCWFRHDQLPLSAPNVAIDMSHTTATNGDHDATTETPIAATATTAPGADENDDGPNDEHE